MSQGGSGGGGHPDLNWLILYKEGSRTSLYCTTNTTQANPGQPIQKPGFWLFIRPFCKKMTKREEGVKNYWFWDDIVYGRPLGSLITWDSWDTSPSIFGNSVYYFPFLYFCDTKKCLPQPDCNFFHHPCTTYNKKLSEVIVMKSNKF